MIDATLVRTLIDKQFPQWSGLPIEPVEPQGWDNRTFRLGATMSVRLPSAECYVAQVTKEQTWLPRLRPHLPLPVPEPIAQGAPNDRFPWPWSIYRWLEGSPACRRAELDLNRFARDLARFLQALHACPTDGAPIPGEANFHRGGSLGVYGEQTRNAIEALNQTIDGNKARAIWAAAAATSWDRKPVWVHGDMAPGNLLTTHGRLSAVIDFGGFAIGDPACDLVIAWTFLDEESRYFFRQSLALDDETWLRAKAWALWKALLILSGQSVAKPEERPARNVIELLFAENGQ